MVFWIANSRKENADYFRLLVALAEKNIRLHTIMKPKEYYYINLNSAGNSDEVFSKSSLPYGCAIVCTQALKLGTCFRPCPSHSHTCARLFSFVGNSQRTRQCCVLGLEATTLQIFSTISFFYLYVSSMIFQIQQNLET